MSDDSSNAERGWTGLSRREVLASGAGALAALYLGDAIMPVTAAADEPAGASGQQESIYAQAFGDRAGDQGVSTGSLGDYTDAVTAWSHSTLPRDSLLNWQGDVAQWRTHAHGVAEELLGRMPAKQPLNAQSRGVVEHNGVSIERISYQLSYGPRMEGLLLKPADADADGKLPGFLALHDHGGFKFWGKEKIVEQLGDDRRPRLLWFRDHIYEGRAWANELARRGYAVFVPDVFTWGSRKIAIEQIQNAAGDRMRKMDPSSDDLVNTYNGWAFAVEAELTKALMTAQMTFSGVIAHEDRRALDYLASRPEVDTSRLGCGGLSGGGLRSIWLAGLDERIAAAFVAGFMPTLQGIAYSGAFHHTFVAFVPGMAGSLDFPDVLSIRAPRPTLVVQCRDDGLFPRSCMRAADEILKAAFEKAGAGDRYRGVFYPGKHQLTRRMQDETFDWLDRQLRR